MLRCLLVGTRGGGGEEVFVRQVADHPPPGVEYRVAWQPHESVPGAGAHTVQEVLFNRLVHPVLRPLYGLRSYRVDPGIDVVHVHNHMHRVIPHATPVVMSLGGATYRHYLEAYLGWAPERVRRLYARARRLLRPLGIGNEFVSWERISAMVVFSHFARDYLLRAGVPAGRVRVIPPGFATPAVPERGRGGRPFTFLFVGRDPVRKGADLVLQAFRALRAGRADVRLLLIGDPSFEALAGEQGVEAHPPMERERLYREAFPASDALLIPSRAEGYGFVAVEAMSFGLPVVATDQGAFPEILDGGRAGILVPVSDGGALAQAMARLADDPEAAREMGLRGRARFEEQHTLERFQARWLAVYEEAIGGAEAGTAHASRRAGGRAAGRPVDG